MNRLQRFKPTDDEFEACTHVVKDQPVIGVNARNNKGKVLAITGYQGDADERESIGNAFLFAEAGTVLHRCGKSPFALLEDSTAMLALLDTMHSISLTLPQEVREQASALVGLLEKAHPLLPRGYAQKTLVPPLMPSGHAPETNSTESAL